MLFSETADRYAEYVIELRRRFHRCPEPAGQEFRTCEMICGELRALGLVPRVVCGTGVLADIEGTKGNGQSGRRAAIRADIDGLQIKEETGAFYASEREGFMHACGHDAHIAMGLAAARMLQDRREELAGSVRLIFQPAEEAARGALQMIESGALEGVDTIYGTHVRPGIEAGKFSVQAGPRMAAADFFTITLHGKSTHGSVPNRGVDPIAAAAAVIQNVQVAISRECPPAETALVSFCQIHGGNTDNAIPDTVTIGGTSRSFSPEVREQILQIMERVIRETAAAFRAEARLSCRRGSSPVINDEEAAARAVRSIAKNFGEDSFAQLPRSTGGEDFAEYQTKIPGVFVFLGVENEALGAVYPNHSSRFSMDESALIRGAVAAAQYCADYLEEEK